MKTKTILTMAIIAAFPFGAMAENISGAMYTAPAGADTNHPAPTTNAGAPYGRANIDTADQEHIATTAYVKGAYNSAIAAVNKVDSDKQAKLINTDNNHSIETNVIGTNDEAVKALQYQQGTSSVEEIMFMLDDIHQELNINYDDSLISAAAVMKLVGEINEYKQQKLVTDNGDPLDSFDTVATSVSYSDTQLVTAGAVNRAIDDSYTVISNAIAHATSDMATNTTLNSKRVRIYTTWDDDTVAATTLVPFEMAQ